MQDDIVIAKIRKSGSAELWIVAKKYNGKPVCDLREYFQPADSPDWLPTRKGVSIPADTLGQAVDAFGEMAAKNAIGLVCEIRRGEKAIMRFGINEYQKHLYGDIRVFYADSVGGEWKPGKGVTVPLSKLNQVADALRLAEDEMAKLIAYRA